MSNKSYVPLYVLGCSGSLDSDLQHSLITLLSLMQIWPCVFQLSQVLFVLLLSSWQQDWLGSLSAFCWVPKVASPAYSSFSVVRAIWDGTSGVEAARKQLPAHLPLPFLSMHCFASLPVTLLHLITSLVTPPALSPDPRPSGSLAHPSKPQWRTIAQ